MTYGWGALGFCVLAALAGIGFAGVRGLAAWRDLRTLRRSTGWGLAELAGGIAAAERQAAALPAGLEELERAQARLAQSLARARVLQAAARDALSPLERVRSAIPRKQL
jgi:hypothetical protein